MSWFPVLNLIGFLKDSVNTPVDKDNRLPTVDYPGSEKDSLNSTETPLTAGATYEGTPVTNNVSEIFVAGKTDQKCILYIDLSTDGGANYDSIISRRIEANLPYVFGFEKAARTYRVRIVNDSGQNQTFLRHALYYGKIDLLRSALDQVVGKEQECLLTRPTIAEDDIIRGLRRDAQYKTQFGYRKINSASAGVQTLWADNSNLVIMTTADTFTITYNNTLDGLGTTGALVLQFEYLDANFELQTATHVLGNTGSDVTSFSGLGINQMTVVSSGTANKNGSIILAKNTTLSNTQSVMPVGTSVSQTSIFHCPINTKPILEIIELTAQKQGGSAPKITFEVKTYNRFTDTEYLAREYELDTSIDSKILEQKKIPLSGRDVVFLTMNTDTNNTVVSFSYALYLYSVVA